MSHCEFTSHLEGVLIAAAEAKARALEKIGLKAEKHAKENLTRFPRVDTGRLRNGVSHANDEDCAYVGTNVPYAVYVEVGTGIHAADGNGRKTPWFYEDDEGNGHITSGMKPAHFLRDAAANHMDEYKEIAKREFKK